MPEFELCGVVRLSLALICNIALDGLPVATFRDGRDVVAITPEFPTPQVFAQFWESPEQFSRRDGFEHADDLGAAVFWVV